MVHLVNGHCGLSLCMYPQIKLLSQWFWWWTKHWPLVPGLLWFDYPNMKWTTVKWSSTREYGVCSGRKFINYIYWNRILLVRLFIQLILWCLLNNNFYSPNYFDVFYILFLTSKSWINFIRLRFFHFLSSIIFPSTQIS